jgi:hypothetical protein
MAMDALLVIALASTAFAIFAGVLFWADLKTNR